VLRVDAEVPGAAVVEDGLAGGAETLEGVGEVVGDIHAVEAREGLVGGEGKEAGLGVGEDGGVVGLEAAVGAEAIGEVGREGVTLVVGGDSGVGFFDAAEADEGAEEVA
jgi:hypothetical protein